MPQRRHTRVLALAIALTAAACGSSASHVSKNGPATSVPGRTAQTEPAPTSTTVARSSPTAALTQRTEPPLPLALQEGGAAVVGNTLYEIAGYDVNRLSSDAVFMFDGTSWHPGPRLPVALNHPGVTSIGNDVYVVGGFTPRGATDRAFVLRNGAGAWQEIASMRRARGALSVVVVNGKLYAFGGRNGSVEVAVPERFDPASGTWSDLPPMPEPRNHGAAYVDGTSACVAGGRTPATTAAIDCFDTQTSTWRRAGMLPYATSGASAAFFAGRVVVAGGEPSSETNLVAFVQELQGSTWSTEAMLVPRHGAANAIYNGRLWQCGGATAPGFHAVATCTSTG